MRATRVNGRASITRRLTALFALVSTSVLLGLGTLIGGTVEQHFVEQDIGILSGKLELARRVLGNVKSEDDLPNVPQQLDDALNGEYGLAIAVAAPDGRRLFATRGAAFPDALLTRQTPVDAARPLRWRTADGVPMRGISARAPTGIPGAPPVVVGVATDISHHAQYMAGFRVTLWSFVAVAALLSGFLGWLAARSGLKPLQAMKHKAERITARRLDARLAVDAVPVELADLAATLNDMLARLEESFRRLSDFSSDLAHEFRTPISNLLTQAQVTLSRPRGADEYREALASSIEEYERLSRMVADMLFIAKADEGRIVPTRERLRLAPLVDDLVEFHRLAADEKGVAIESGGEGAMLGDPLMIRRAIGNLLSNAIRHTPPGGRVSVSIHRAEPERVAVEVTNSGETIPPEYLPRLFDRFYRASSRASDGSHSGLGLAIVKSIAETHGGSAAVSSSGGVTRFSLLFGAAEPDT
ncbi:MAG: heavy metal sensor histidine kinase [Candidatus Accumulibacter sp.]|jgi:two-component system heavy metal sensor histidine kinase CusS|nr:heavy metal sensor histidine kinase [Accumulibacter sp.]